MRRCEPHSLKDDSYEISAEKFASKHARSVTKNGSLVWYCIVNFISPGVSSKMDSIKEAPISPQDPYGKLLSKYVNFYASTIVNVELSEKITLFHAQASGVHRHAIHNMHCCMYVYLIYLISLQEIHGVHIGYILQQH